MSQKFQASVQHRGDVSYVKLGGVIDALHEHTSDVKRSRAKRLSLLRRRGDFAQAQSQGVIDEFLEPYLARFAKLLKFGCDVIVDRQGRPHASKHKRGDVLMSRFGIERRRSPSNRIFRPRRIFAS